MRYVIGLFCLLGLAKAQTEPIKICVDNTNWVPFIYLEDSQPKGLHIDIITTALDSLDYDYEFHPVPWKRCLKGLEKGTYDAVATASYNQDRSTYLHYPNNSSTVERTFWRVSQVEYVIATTQNKSFTFANNFNDIPKPIRIPRGYSVAQDLKDKHITVDDSAINDFQNIKRLLREKTGSVITLASVIDWYNQNYESELIYSAQPLASKAYYFATAKSGQLNFYASEQIWNEISKVRTIILNKMSESMMEQETP